MVAYLKKFCFNISILFSIIRLLFVFDYHIYLLRSQRRSLSENFFIYITLRVAGGRELFYLLSTSVAGVKLTLTSLVLIFPEYKLNPLTSTGNFSFLYIFSFSKKIVST